MTGRKWLGVGFAIAVVIAAHALGDGSAKAAELRPLGTAQVAAAGNASATGEIVLAGFTSQRLPAFFKLSGDGRILLASGIAIRETCTSGTQAVVPDGFAHIPIGAGGRLHTTFVPPTTTENGITSGGIDALTASFDPAHSTLTGTWRLKLHVSMANGQSTQCDSGPVRFAASR
jgi:hypothetical protein